MRLPFFVTLLSIVLLLVSVQHVYEVHSQAAAILKGIFYGTQAVTLGLSVASWASGGCSYFPSICDLKDEIEVLTPQVENIASRLNADAARLKEMDGVNTDFYNTLTSANGKNERIVGKLEMIRQYSADIVVLLDKVAGIEVTNIDPEQMETDVTAINNNIAGVQAQIKSLKESMQMHKYMHGAFLAIEILPKTLYFANNAYKHYKWRKSMKNIDTSNFQRSKIQKITGAQQATGAKMGRMQRYLNANPRIAKALKVAAYGVGFLLNGVILYFDITTAKASRDSLMQVRDDLKNIIADSAETQNTISDNIATEITAAAEMEGSYDQIKEGFVNSSDFMNQVREYSDDYYDQSISSIPVYTEKNVNKNNIVSCQNQYIDWLISQEQNLQGFFNRMKAVESVVNMVKLPTPPMFAFQLLMMAKAHDPTIELDIVLDVIADTKPDLNSWPDMDMTTYQMLQHDLTQYRNN
ncbi:unnamed protein product [Owenia fusiformis]|uniref:Uncharacterized protein n=1 Tax=Owenia fusiformis TaxID=6347 RepID=A0A8J1XLP1_OWEFU|nr:unnamed protein product [Owenia fusiformis]